MQNWQLRFFFLIAHTMLLISQDALMI